MLHQLRDGLCLLQRGVVVALKHQLKRPLGPVVVVGRAGADLAVPVERETDLVQLLAVAVYVLECGLFRMLACLDGILLGRQSVGVITHRIQHVVALLTLVARIDVAGDVAQWMAHVQSCTRWVGKHVQHIEFLL